MNISPKQYTWALFEIGQEKKGLDIIINELKKLNDNPADLKNFLENPHQNASEKEKNLMVMGMSTATINLLLILLKNKDIDKLNSIIGGLKNLRDEKNNSVTILATTAHDLSDIEKTALKESLRKKLSKKVELEIKINPEILGGMILQIGDTLIDNSLKNRLILLKQDLIK